MTSRRHYRESRPPWFDRERYERNWERPIPGQYPPWLRERFPPSPEPVRPRDRWDAPRGRWRPERCWGEPRWEPRVRSWGEERRDLPLEGLPWEERGERQRSPLQIERIDYQHGKVLPAKINEEFDDNDGRGTRNPLPPTTNQSFPLKPFKRPSNPKFKRKPRGPPPNMERRHYYGNDYIPMEPKGSSLTCDICDISMTNIEQLQLHLVGDKHLKELERRGLKDDIGTSLTGESNSIESEGTLIEDRKKLYCKVCREQCPPEIKGPHVVSDIHLIAEEERKLKGLMIPSFHNLFVESLEEIEKEEREMTYPLYCEMCNVHSENVREHKSHLEGKGHLIMIEETISKGISQTNETSTFSCDVCNVKLSNEKEFDIHNNSPNHAWNVLNKLDQGSDQSKFFSCDVCKVSFTTNNELTYHFISSEHVQKIKLINSASATPPPSSVTSIKMATDFILSSKTSSSHSIVPYTSSPVTTHYTIATPTTPAPVFHRTLPPLSSPRPATPSVNATTPINLANYIPMYAQVAPPTTAYLQQPQWAQTHTAWATPQTTWTQTQTAVVWPWSQTVVPHGYAYAWNYGYTPSPPVNWNYFTQTTTAPSWLNKKQ